jgi:hypothetical protein
VAVEDIQIALSRAFNRWPLTFSPKYKNAVTTHRGAEAPSVSDFERPLANSHEHSYDSRTTFLGTYARDME